MVAKKHDTVVEGMTVEDARKLLKAAQVEVVMLKLRKIQKSYMPLPKFIQICSENCSDQDQAIRIRGDSSLVIALTLIRGYYHVYFFLPLFFLNFSMLW